MRDSKYARELASVSKFWGSSEAKIERIYVKEFKQDEIRFSWWNEGRLIPRPLDVPEEDLLFLIQKALEAGVFSADFLSKLKKILETNDSVLERDC